MSLTGRNTLSLRKKDVLEQKQAGSAYKRLVFAHKATAAGQTGINITSLTQPSEMAALGFTNPSTAELQAGKMLFYKKNLTVISSSKGLLIQDLSYTVPTNERIAFQGFTSDENEIFTCVLESSVKDGLQVVDAIAITSTGDLAISATDYNVGTPFQVGKNITTQMGSVLVFRDGVLQARNDSNGLTGGNYKEVDAGGGLGSIIRFNDTPVSTPASIIVVSNGSVAERPTGSLMAVVESLAGQMDLVIPTVAALAGQPETNYQGAPNNVDLKNFGDKVAALLTAEVPITQALTNAGTITVDAVTSAPTKGTVAIDRVQYARNGDLGFFRYEYKQTAGSGNAGSGDYLYSLPAGLSFDSSKVNFITTALANLDSIDASYGARGSGSSNASASSSGTGDFIIPYDATRFRIMAVLLFSNAQPHSSVFYQLTDSQIEYAIEFTAPISGWAATQTLAQQLGL